MNESSSSTETHGATYPTNDWAAWCDTMPPGPKTLHVKGTVVVPSTGYRATLKRHVPPGINPDILLLTLVVTEPTGITNPAVEEIEVRYSQEGCVSGVSILPEGVDLEVEIVS